MKKHRSRLRGLLGLALLCAALLGIFGCSSPEADQSEVSTTEETPASPEEMVSPVEVRVSSLKGPTSIGLVDFIDKTKVADPSIQNDYHFTIAGTADEVLPALISGETDIALIPANAASVVYNKTDGGIRVLNVNTLGVLHVVSADANISSIEDLAGKTVMLTGKGTTPEYVINTLLTEAGIADQVNLEFKSEATELAAALVADPSAIAVLPEPYVSSVLAKDESLSRRIDITEAWKQATGENLVTGVTVVRTAFAEEHPEVVEEFAKLQSASVEAVNADPANAAPKIVSTGIIENERIAEKAIPGCNLVCLDNTELESALSHYLEALFAQDPASIGGSLPDKDFYLTT